MCRDDKGKYNVDEGSGSWPHDGQRDFNQGMESCSEVFTPLFIFSPKHTLAPQTTQENKIRQVLIGSTGKNSSGFNWWFNKVFHQSS